MNTAVSPQPLDNLQAELPLVGKPSEAVGYIMFKLKEKWPSCVGLADDSDTYTQWSSSFPPKLLVFKSDDKISAYKLFRHAPEAVEVRCRKGAVSVTAPPSLQAEFDFIIKLPIWTGSARLVKVKV